MENGKLKVKEIFLPLVETIRQERIGKREEAGGKREEAGGKREEAGGKRQEGRKFFSRWSKNILYNCFSNAERKATFIPNSAFRIPHSEFRIPHSAFYFTFSNYPYRQGRIKFRNIYLYLQRNVP